MTALSPVLIAALLAPTAGTPPRPTTSVAEPPLPPGAKLRLGTTRFRAVTAGRMTALSPDGRAVITFQYPDTIRYLSVDTGAELKTVKVAGDPQTGGWYNLHRTPDGRRLVVLQYNAVLVLDAATGAVVYKVDLRDDNPRLGGLGGNPDGLLALSGDGSRLAVGSRYQRNNEGATAAVLDAATGKVIATVKPGQSNSIRTALSPDGKRLATFGQFFATKPNDENWAAVVQVWDAATGAETCRVRTGVPHQVQAVAFSPDGKLLVTAAPGGPVQGWDPATGKPVRQYVGRSSIGQQFFFSPDGTRLAGTGADGTVQVWETATGKRLAAGGAAVHSVADVVFPPGGGPAVALGAIYQTIQVWTVPGGVLTPQAGHLGAVTALRFTPDGKHLVSAGQDGRVIRWDTSTGAELGQLGRPSGDARRGGPWFFYQAAITPDGRTAIVPNGGTGLAVVDLEAGTEDFSVHFPGGRSGSDVRVAVSADGRRIAGSYRFWDRGKTGTVAAAWDLESGQPLAEYRVEQDGNAGWMENAAVTITPDGRRMVVAVARRDRTGSGTTLDLTALDLATGGTVAKAAYPVPAYYPVLAAAADGRSVLVPAADNKAGVWDLPSGKVTRTLDVPTGGGPATWFRFSPDGRLVATVVSEPGRPGTNQGVFKLKVLEWASGTPRFEWEVPTMAQAAEFSPDGTTLAVGGQDTTILLYDLTGAADPVPGATEPTAPDKLWARLSTGGAAEGWAALRELAARPEVAVPLVKRKVKPAAVKPRPTPAELAQLITRLDAPAFADREAAGRALRVLGPAAEAAVRAAVRETASAEVRQRLEKIADALNRPDPVSVAEVRAVELLERIGAGPARDYLAALAGGEPTAPLTRDAAAALRRLGSKK